MLFFFFLFLSLLFAGPNLSKFVAVDVQAAEWADVPRATDDALVFRLVRAVAEQCTSFADGQCIVPSCEVTCLLVMFESRAIKMRVEGTIPHSTLC